MRRLIIDFFKGNALISEDAAKNWRFILFIVLLFTIMIYAAHGVDQKVIKIDGLSRQLSALRNEHVDGRQRVQLARLESTLKKELANNGLAPTEQPPLILMIK